MSSPFALITWLYSFFNDITHLFVCKLIQEILLDQQVHHILQEDYRWPFPWNILKSIFCLFRSFSKTWKAFPKKDQHWRKLTPLGTLFLASLCRSCWKVKDFLSVVIDGEHTLNLNQVIRVTAGASTEREVKKPRIRLVANMHGDYDHNYNYVWL